MMIGGGLVACETALFLERKGKNVTVVEILDDILATGEHCRNNDEELRKMIGESGVRVLTGTKATEIGVDFVTAVDKEGNEIKLACDTVVIAVGFRSAHWLEECLKKFMDEEDLAVIGDAVRPDKIYTAVHEGFHAVRRL